MEMRTPFGVVGSFEGKDGRHYSVYGVGQSLLMTPLVALGGELDERLVTLINPLAVALTGALLVLLFGVANGLLWASVLMVIAISLGMAVALSSIGIAAILGRRFVERRLDHNETRRRQILASLRITGAALVLFIGLALFSLTLLGGTFPAETPTAGMTEGMSRT